MPNAAKKDLPQEDTDDDFDFGSFDELAAVMVDALTIPVAADPVPASADDPPAAGGSTAARKH